MQLGGADFPMKEIPETITQAIKKAQQATEEWVMTLEEQVATFGMTTNEARIYQAGIAGVAKETLNAARAADKLLVSKQRLADMDAVGKSLMSQVGLEILKLERGYDNLDMMLFDFRWNTGASIDEMEKFGEMVNKLRALRDKKEEQKRQLKSRDLTMRAAAQVGTAESQARILTFREGAGITSDAKQTADNTERIAETLERIDERGESLVGGPPTSGLRRS